MTEHKHTPGPWTVSINYGRSITRHQIKEGRNNLVVAFTSGHGMSFRDKTDEANARLIAAAPDLLEALELAQHVLVNILEIPDYDKDVIKINEAIARATQTKD